MGYSEIKLFNKVIALLIFPNFLLYKGVGAMADKFAKGSTGMGYLKGALNAVKTEELGVFLKKAFAAI